MIDLFITMHDVFSPDYRCSGTVENV